MSGSSRDVDPDALEGVVRTGEWFEVGDEFAGVQVRKVSTRNRELLQLWVPARNHTILFDATLSEILSAQDADEFSALFGRGLGLGGVLGGQRSEDES